jgi:hypothetical protein
VTRFPAILLLTAVVLFGGCREKKRPPPRRVVPTAPVAPPRRGGAVAAPRSVPVTGAQRVYDRQHRVVLLQIVGDLDRLYTHSLALQARGVRKPATQDAWPREREQLLTKAGRIRVRILAVDPLTNRSWASARATVLLRYLTVRLPDAIRESWRMRPSGAFTTWRSDFRLIWSRLQRYVRSLLKQPSGPPSKDTK